MSNTKATGDMWFVIHCDRDDSTALVASDCVICEDNVRKGDKVKFVMKKSDKKFENGTVKGFDSDYNKMKKKQDEWNRSNKPSREPSFHADQPRRAKVKCMNKVSDSNKSKNARSERHQSQCSSVIVPKANVSQQSSSSAKKKPTLLDADKISGAKKSSLSKVLSDEQPELIHSSGDSSDSESINVSSYINFDAVQSKQKSFKKKDIESKSVAAPHLPTEATSVTSSSSSDELSQEEMDLLKKLAQKKKKMDFKALMNISASKSTLPKEDFKEKAEIEGLHLPKKIRVANLEDDGNNVQASSSTLNEDPFDEFDDTEDKSKEDRASVSGHEDSDGEKKKHCNAPKTPKVPVPPVMVKGDPFARSRNKRKRIETLSFDKEYFRFKATDKGVVALSDEFQVYVNSQDLKELRVRAKSSTAVARGLVRMVFSDEAIATCSVSGKPHALKGTGTMEVRPPLDADGVAAILDFCKKRAKKLAWPEPNVTSLKQAMGNAICDERWIPPTEQ